MRDRPTNPIRSSQAPRMPFWALRPSGGTSAHPLPFFPFLQTLHNGFHPGGIRWSLPTLRWQAGTAGNGRSWWTNPSLAHLRRDHFGARLQIAGTSFPPPGLPLWQGGARGWQSEIGPSRLPFRPIVRRGQRQTPSKSHTYPHRVILFTGPDGGVPARRSVARRLRRVSVRRVTLSRFEDFVNPSMAIK